jgi:hypothetical protein
MRAAVHDAYASGVDVMLWVCAAIAAVAAVLAVLFLPRKPARQAPAIVPPAAGAPAPDAPAPEAPAGAEFDIAGAE